MRGIHNYAHFLLEDYGDQLGEEGSSKLTTMMTLTERMDALIEGLLHYSAGMGREKKEIEFESTNLNEVVRRVIQMLTPRLEQLGVVVRVRDVLPTVYANPVLMQEIFANLITNAMKYNDKAEKWIEIGRIVDAEPLSRAEQELAKDREVVYVRDNGIGILLKDHATIFQIFRRCCMADINMAGGTGT